MAFNDIERATNQKAIDWFLERRRPPVHIRPELDIGIELKGQTVDIFEIRPDWQDEKAIMQTPVARMRFVRTEKLWKLYWMRRDLKWHAYEPSHAHKTLLSALKVVDTDALCCFFG